MKHKFSILYEKLYNKHTLFKFLAMFAVIFDNYLNIILFSINSNFHFKAYLNYSRHTTYGNSITLQQNFLKGAHALNYMKKQFVFIFTKKVKKFMRK